jgi:hypothetical protein
MSEAIETATTPERPRQRDAAELTPLDHAAFRFAFF